MEGDRAKVVIRHVSDETGKGLFLKEGECIRAGERVLRERPIVFAQSYATSDFTHPSSAINASSCVAAPTLSLSDAQRMRCCFGCGTPLISSMWAEVQRVAACCPPSNSPDASTLACDAHGECGPIPCSRHLASTRSRQRSVGKGEEKRKGSRGALDSFSEQGHLASSSASVAPQEAVRVWLLCHRADGEAMIVCFCSQECQERAMHDDGARFIVSAYTPPDVVGIHDGASAAAAHAAVKEVSAYRFPSLIFIWQHQHPSSWSLTPTAAAGDALPCHPDTKAALWHQLWPTRLQALDTIHHIAMHYNERLWLIVRLLAKLFSQTLAACEAETAADRKTWDDEMEKGRRGVQLRALDDAADGGKSRRARWTAARLSAFRASLDACLTRYADGATRSINTGQRALLRFSWHVICWWLSLCLRESFSSSHSKNTGEGCEVRTDEEDEEEVLFCLLQREALPLQCLLQLHWLMDANVHAYIVVSPLLTWWCRMSGASEASHSAAAVKAADAPVADAETPRRTHVSEKDEDADGTNSSRALLAQVKALLARSSCRSVDQPPRLSGAPSAEESAPHVSGTALYDTATRLNHSCVPSVRFIPNHGPVCADVVALTPLNSGEQLFTSYINLDAYAPPSWSTREAAEQRRAALLDGYGFTCMCPMCAILDQ